MSGKAKETTLALVAGPGCCAPPRSGNGCGCGVTADAGLAPSPEGARATPPSRHLDVALMVIDLETCSRCVPTGDRLREAVRLLAPVADALGVELRHRETVVRTVEEAKALALSSSPTIRLNGRDIAQDVRESTCESCGDLTRSGTLVDCREWHYRGKVYPAAPLPLLVEAIVAAMLAVEPPVTPAPLAELPENLERFFANAKRPSGCC